MQLCDKDIHKAIVNGDIGFVGTNENFPFVPERQVQPGSIDLRLGDIIVKFKESVKSVDIKNTINSKEYLEIKKYKSYDPITIAPKEILYGQVYEQMWIGDNYSARIEGRSRVARLGLSIHCTGSYINPGFCGAMPLQIINFNSFPITIYPYIEICQVIISQISGEPLIKYSEKSRILNPYFDENIASPSVLKQGSNDSNNNFSIVEKRMTQLVNDYYKGLESERFTYEAKMSDREKIEIVVKQNMNMQQGEFFEMRDQYNANQVGNQGPNSGQNTTITQSYYDISNIDFSKLENELTNIKTYLKNNTDNDEENDILIGEVSKALKALKEKRKQKAIETIKKIGKQLYEIAKSIGCSVVATLLTNQMEFN